MKTDRTHDARETTSSSSSAPKETFQSTLRRLPPRRDTAPAPGKAPAVGARVAQRSATQVLSPKDRATTQQREVRARLDAQVEKQGERRGELDARSHRTAEERVLERAGQQLAEERGQKGSTPRPLEPAAVESPGPLPSRGTAKAEDVGAQPPSSSPPAAITGGERRGAPAQASQQSAAVELVQKIEVWVRSSRPTLSMTVGGALAAEVTVERTGQGRVSLSFRGTNGPPSHSDVRAVRDALEARGLQLTSLRIA